MDKISVVCRRTSFSEYVVFGGNVGRHWNFKILHMGLCWTEIFYIPEVKESKL